MPGKTSADAVQLRHERALNRDTFSLTVTINLAAYEKVLALAAKGRTSKANLASSLLDAAITDAWEKSKQDNN